MVKSVFDESGLSVAEFARRIHCERTNVYKIFNRQSVDVEILVKISDALEHNFLEDVMKHYGFETKTVNKLSLNITFDDISDEDVAALAKTIESLKSSKKSCE
ncbi:MAG: helix-turn-helix transcriptional regulator [Bacteroidales bacterium]|nr:helix-turn-helix transcriptional regulator [Bacteroidales bacterium]